LRKCIEKLGTDGNACTTKGKLPKINKIDNYLTEAIKLEQNKEQGTIQGLKEKKQNISSTVADQVDTYT
jgi:hypothetical protein